MSKFALIVGASFRNRWRWAREHLYAILILSPLVVGMTYLTAARVASYAPPEWRPSAWVGVGLATLALAALWCLSLSRVSAEIYHLRSPESAMDALPVERATHLNAALAKRLARTFLTGLGVLVVRSLLNEDASFADAWLWPSLAVFVVLAALCEILGALEWIHWGHTREKGQALAGVAALAPGLVLAGALLVGIIEAEILVEPEILPKGSRLALVVAGAVWSAALYVLARRLHWRWRASDMEYAKRLQASSRRSLFGARFVGRLGNASVAAQIARDLQLTLRAFSSAVYVAVLVAGLWVAALVAGLTTGLLPSVMLPPGEGEAGFVEATWLLPVVATKVACVLAVLSLVSILPVLVAYQFPHRWLERAAGTKGAEMWTAKLWYARLVSLPAPIVVWAAATACGASPMFYVLPLLLECLWLWWLVSTLMGSLAFETPDQPGLSLILMAFAGLSGGLLTAWLWPLGLLGGMAISQMSERGPHQAQILLATEGD
ncbi:MAG TPA: hypothetical protein VGB73_19625 [Pyrinomonadaceae bacterium]